MAFEIEKDVPLPPARTAHSKYPFDLCDSVGDSFLVETDTPKTKVAGIRAAAKRSEKRTGHKFIVRQLPEGIRVWRVG